METKSIIFSIDNRKDLVGEIIKSYNLLWSSDNEEKSTSLIKGEVCLRHFSDGEVSVDYETSVRGHIVYLVSSPNTADKILGLNIAIDAAKRAGAREIIPIIPYFPYARQDKKDYIRGGIGAKVLAEMIENRGATGVITFDLHANQIEGFFNIPVTHMEGKYLFDDSIRDIYSKKEDVILCSPDAGGVKRVKQFRDRMKEIGIDLSYVTIDKTRAEANVIDGMEIIGDVENKHVIIIDDMVDTAGTLVKASKTLIESGATGVSAISTHGILSGPAIERIHDAIEDKTLTEFICSNSLQIKGKEFFIAQGVYPKAEDFISVVSISNQVAKAIYANSNHESIEELKHE